MLKRGLCWISFRGDINLSLYSSSSDMAPFVVALKRILPRTIEDGIRDHEQVALGEAMTYSQLHRLDTQEYNERINSNSLVSRSV